MPDQFAERVGPVLQGALEPGEALQGIAAATLQKTFSGGLFAIGVTDRRLVGWLGGAPGGSLTRTRGGGGV